MFESRQHSTAKGKHESQSSVHDSISVADDFGFDLNQFQFVPESFCTKSQHDEIKTLDTLQAGQIFNKYLAHSQFCRQSLTGLLLKSYD